MSAYRLAVILLVTYPLVATAQNTCDNQTFNSHADKIACEIKQTYAKFKDVNKAFDQLMYVNAQFEQITGTASNLFTSRLGENQEQWRSWVKNNCSLEGDVSMGTAGSDIEQQCLQDAADARIKELHHMAELLPH